MMMVRLLSLLLVLLFTCSVHAERPRVLARAMANIGNSFHGSYQGRENTYWESSGTRLGVRMRARQAWQSSPGHRANLPMFGLRVVRGTNGIGVVGRR